MYRTISEVFFALGDVQEQILDARRGEPIHKDALESWDQFQGYLATVLSNPQNRPFFSFSPQDVVLANALYGGDVTRCRKEVAKIKPWVDSIVQGKVSIAESPGLTAIHSFLGRVVEAFWGQDLQHNKLSMRASV